MTTNDRTGAHTPGPWTMETIRTSCGIVHKIGPFPGKVGKDGWTHACVYDDYPPNKHSEELAANARLIAAAPALLKALRAVERARHTDESSDWARATTLTDAAIAQATGGHHDL